MSRAVVVVDKPAGLRSVSGFGPTRELLEAHHRRVLETSKSVADAEFERATRRERFARVVGNIATLPSRLRERAAHLPRSKGRFIKYCSSKSAGCLSFDEANKAWAAIHRAVRQAEAAEGLIESDSVVKRVRDVVDDACPVHRIDAGTSGLLAVALNSKAAGDLCEQWRTRQVQKKYEALVDGHVREECGDVNLPLARVDAPRREGAASRMLVVPGGKECHTTYHVKHRYRHWPTNTHGASATKLDLVPHTGRLHQLRAHLAAIGHPILGDPLYGSPFAAARAPRLCLHNAGLVLRDPDSDGIWHLHSPAPW